MMKKIIEHIDFADSAYHSIKTDGSKVIVLLTSWDGRMIKLTFSDVIQFVYKLCDGTQEIVESNDQTVFFQEALKKRYGTIPSHHPYLLYQILDLDDYPYIEIVAKRVDAIKEF